MPLTKVDAQLLEGAITADASGNVQINGAAGSYRANLYDASNAFWSFTAGAGSPLVLGQDSNGDSYLQNNRNATLRLGTNNMEMVRIAPDGSMTMRTAAGLGYGTGAGGTVTQATSKSTAVTLNRPSGQITMNAAALAAGTTVGFTLNNSLIAASDSVVVTNAGGNGGNANYQVWVYIVQAGSCLIAVRNVSGGSLSESVAVNFAIIKGATA